MSSLLAKARNSTKNIITNRTPTNSSSNNSNLFNNNDSLNEDEEAGSYSLHTDTTESEEVAPKESDNNKSNSKIRPGVPIIKRLSSRQLSMRRQQSIQEDYQLKEEEEIQSSPSLESAHLKQTISPFSTLFAVVQCIILPVMMWQCGVAPMKINPMIGPYPDALNYWGAKNGVLIIDDGEWWRLFTPIFLHAGLIHLVGNVMVQIESGNRWEKEWGSLIWLVVYIGSAFGSSILSVCVMPDQIGVGSSGAVMGLFGAKFAEILLMCCERSETRAERAGERSRKEQACLVIGGIIIVMAMSFIPYVDWAAHLGGLCAGFVIGMVCFSFKIRNWFFIFVWFVVGVGSAIALFSAGLAYMYNKVEASEDLRDGTFRLIALLAALRNSISSSLYIQFSYHPSLRVL
jgi:membrane associated rhomboid family serine protease